MQKKNFLILSASVVISACAFCGFMSKMSLKTSEKTEDVEISDSEQEGSFEEALSYEDMVEAYYKNRPIREIPDTADFSAYLAAEHAKANNEFSKAAVYFKRAADADLDNIDFQKEAAYYSVLSGNVEQAVPYAYRVLDKEPNDFFNRLLVVSFLIKNQKDDQALEQLDKLSSGSFLGFVSPLIKSWIYAQQNDEEAAFSLLSRLNIETDNGLKSLYFLHTALMHDYFENYDAAAGFYNQLLHSRESHSVRTLMLIRSFEERTGKLPEKDYFLKSYLQTQMSSFVSNEVMSQRPYQEQINTLDKVVSLILFDIGGSLGYLKNYDSALFLSQLSLYMDGENTLNVYFTGDVLEALNAFDKANDLYAKIGSKQPLYWSFQIRSAMNKIKMKQEDEAIRQLKNMITQRPNIPLFYMTLGDAYQKKEDFRSAQKAYDMAILKMGTENKETGLLYFLRGTCYEKLSQTKEAQADMEKAVLLDENNSLYLNYLGYLMLENGKDLPKAMTLIEKAVQLLPNNGAILDSQGWGYYLMGDYEKSQGLLEKAAQLEPENAVISDHLGDVYWKLNRRREARFQWSHALILKEENSESLKNKIKEKLKNQE